jgi:hypothetical protein
MGFAPADVERMSLFQYMAAVDGFADANSPDGEGKLSTSEADELWSWLQSKE